VEGLFNRDWMNPPAPFRTRLLLLTPLPDLGELIDFKWDLRTKLFGKAKQRLDLFMIAGHVNHHLLHPLARTFDQHAGFKQIVHRRVLTNPVQQATMILG
jgi:hypothetical protein